MAIKKERVKEIGSPEIVRKDVTYSRLKLFNYCVLYKCHVKCRLELPLVFFCQILVNVILLLVDHGSLKFFLSK